MTAKQLFLGPSGAGAAMKLALNGLLAATNQALAEALVLAERNGIEPAAAYDAVGASVLGSPYVAYKRSAFLAPSDEPVAFTVALLQKDLDLLLSLGEHLGVPLTTASAVRDALGEAREVVGDDADLAAVATALRTRAQQTEAR
jgi:3-hydroxyisobutyrate dehydrogenase-like beta-hydroxyacid dehydrogenase